MVLSFRKYRALVGFALAIIVLTGGRPAVAQVYDQEELAALYSSYSDSVLAVEPVSFRYAVLDGQSDLWARNRFWDEIGTEHRSLLRFINRKRLDQSGIGDSIIVPITFAKDLRAYSIWPQRFPSADSLGKVFAVDLSTQTYAAYENGHLIRWGVVSTGKPSSPTPPGRYNFNWKTEHRISSLSPPGSPWHMYWVFNFDEGRGIHTHQYALPVAEAASHGCVRMSMVDAEWLYNWADGWQKRNGRLVKPGTMVLVLGETPERLAASYFRKVTTHVPTTENTPTTNPGPAVAVRVQPQIVPVVLPSDPYKIKPGTSQQRLLDRQRARRLAVRD